MIHNDNSCSHSKTYKTLGAMVTSACSRGERVGVVVVLLVVLVVSSLPRRTDGAKIMLATTSLFNSASQYMFFSSITETLVERGHEVILLAPRHKPTTGLRPGATTDAIWYTTPYTAADFGAMHDTIKNTMVQGSKIRSHTMMVYNVLEGVEYLRNGCPLLFKDTNTLARLKQEAFDMIVTFPVNGCDALLAAYLGVPFTIVTPTRRVPAASEDHFNMPIPSSYVPFSIFSDYSDHMSFKERLYNTIFRFVLHPAFEWYLARPLYRIKREFNIRPDLSVRQLVGEASLWLTQSTFALDYAQPTAPFWIPIGGITAKTPRPLPGNLKEFVEGSGDHGVVILSLGSMLASMSDHKKDAMFAKVLNELPQRVVWVRKGVKPANLGKNTLVLDWIPQSDLLAHPKTRVIIAHGGSGGVYESVMHGVPLVVMPFGADQTGNAARVGSRGLGKIVDFDTLTEDIFRQALHELLHNDSYARNMKKASDIMNDDLAPPAERAAFWIEHVIKFGGNHLRLRATDLNFIQLHSLDVMGFFLLLSIVWLKVFVCFFRKCCGSSRKKDDNKSKGD